MIKEWLRWTHEATVVGVVEMADGDYVMTFETGKIGVNLRPLSQILNRWDIFAGFIPEAASNPARLDDMLDINKLILAAEPHVEVEAQPALAFSLPMTVEPIAVEEEAVGEPQVGVTSGKKILLR